MEGSSLFFKLWSIVFNLQLFKGSLYLTLFEGSTVVLLVVFHKGDAFAHHRLGDHCVGRGFILYGSLYSLVQGLIIVAVNLNHLPSIGFVVGLYIHGHYVHKVAAYLFVVVIYHYGDVVESKFLGELPRFGDLTLYLLCIGHEHEGVVIQPSHLCCQCKTAPCREALSQVACGPLNSRYGPFHMAFKYAASLSKGGDGLFYVKEAQPAHNRVDCGRGVTVAYDYPVSVLSIGIVGKDLGVGEDYQVDV